MLKITTRNQRKANVHVIPRRKHVCHKANNMTRNLFIVFLSIHHPSISSPLSSELFYTIPGGLNPINPNRKVMLRASCILTTPQPPPVPLAALSVCSRIPESTAPIPPFQEVSGRVWSLPSHQLGALGHSKALHLLVPGASKEPEFHRENKTYSSDWK